MTTSSHSSPTPVLLLGGAGAAWTAAQAVLPDMGTATSDRYDAVAASPGLESLSAALFFVAAVLLALGSHAVARRLPAGRGHRLLLGGTGLLSAGAIWLAAGRGAFNLEFAALVDPAVPRETAIDLLDAPSGLAMIPLVLTLPCLLLGPVLMAIGARRAGLASWTPLVLWVVGIGAFVATEFVLKVGEVAGVATAAVALALLGAASARVPAAEVSDGVVAPASAGPSRRG